MTPRAARIVARRKQREAEVEKRYEQELREAQRRQRTLSRLPIDFVEETARGLLEDFKNDDEATRQMAQRLMSATPEVQARVYELAGVKSRFKQRRSRQTNGY